MTEQDTQEFRIYGKNNTIFFQGKITSEVTGILMDTYQLLVTNEIRLDFSALEQIDISGINALIKLYLHAQDQGKKLAAQGVSPYLKDVFTTVALDEAIPVEPAGAEGIQGPVQVKDSPWARPVASLSLSHVPQGAVNLNIEGFHTVGPVQGFGRLWEKTYTVRLAGISITPYEVIRTLKEHFPEFQPQQNRFYPPPAGIVPGEIVLINACTPLGPIYTGVWVVHADDETFTFMTPQGHPESGWVTFSAYEQTGAVVAQVQGFARANDPVYELGFVLAGSKVQEQIWTHVLSSLAEHLGVKPWVNIHKTCVGPHYQWDQVTNIWYNAQIRSTLYSLRNMMRRTG
ncbi:MAG TPA: DUF1990 family protein [Deltaproteobacteria bacterium]|nr:DUF1990 family protein [Deltaproteobacteria bacterium]